MIIQSHKYLTCTPPEPSTEASSHSHEDTNISNWPFIPDVATDASNFTHCKHPWVVEVKNGNWTKFLANSTSDICRYKKHIYQLHAMCPRRGGNTDYGIAEQRNCVCISKWITRMHSRMIASCSRWSMVERVHSESPTPLIRTLLGPNPSVLIRRVSLFQGLHIKSIICYLYTLIATY